MEITPELIQKFLANECEPDEFERIVRYLEAHPKEADRWLDSGDWDAIDSDTPVADHDQRAVYARLRERLFPAQGEIASSGRVRRMVWPAVAASLLLVSAGVWMNRRRVHAPEGAVLATRTTSKVIDTLDAAGKWVVRVNAGVKPQKLVLPDGSGVTLYAHSRLSYAAGFGFTGRESRLEGTADFSVHKNKVLPFTVHSGILSTTALGTSFGVKAPMGGKTVEIKLYTGRVVVKAVAVAGWSKDVFLSPGEKISYSGSSAPAVVSRFEVSPAAGDNSSDEQDLVFNNASLKQVFKKLAIQYHVTISYRAADLNGMNFTGTVSPSESLQPLLKLLGNMNNLEIREEAGGYRVVRQQ